MTISHPDWVREEPHARRAAARNGGHCSDEFDVVLCPAMPTAAFPHDHSPQRDRQLDVDGKQVPYLDQIVWASMATLTGLPATAAPIGRIPEGLPIGVQIIGPYLEDRTPITFAGLIEREFGGSPHPRICNPFSRSPGASRDPFLRRRSD